MKSALSLSMREHDPNHPEVTDAEERGAPPSRVRPHTLSSESPSGRDPLDLYYADLAGRRHLTREGEVALGRRIEAAEQAIIAAWIRSPHGLAELALTADDVEAGVLEIDDLLIEPDTRDAEAAKRTETLGALLEWVRALASSKLTGAAATRAVDEISAGLAALPLDPTVGERIERSLRTAATEAPPKDRAGIEATLAEIARSRRAVARAKSELVEANLRLAVSIARQFQRFDVPLVDLAQEGNLGLIRAADRFDYRRGHRFSTYAVWWIKQAIRRAVLRQGKGLRMPAHLAEARSRIARTRRELIGQLGRDPSHEEVAERSGVPIERVRVIAELALEPLSLDAPVGEDGDTSFGELVAGNEPMADETLAKRRLVEQTHELLEGLTPREREVLVRRYGLHDREDETLEEIGRSCSLTRERIRQIEAQALEKLRTRSRKRKLSSYLDG
ncbi:RNA polymerase sigma factor RpoD [Minicystis rosea]|nr:RNA polymerase sigma factor RpoD [Minicystis rosea]